MANPLSSLLPKDTESGSDPNGMAGRMESQKSAEDALKPTPVKSTGGPIMDKGGPYKIDKGGQGPYGTGPGEKRIDTTFPGTPMPKFHQGGTVKQDGPAMLKKGEHVLTLGQHSHLKSAMSLAQSALSHDAEKQEPEAPKILKSLHVKELHTGGFHVQKHDGKGGMTEHGAPDNDSVVGHFMDHMGHPDEDEEAVEAGDHDMSAADTEHKAIGG